MKEPVLEDEPVDFLRTHASTHDDRVRHPAEAHQTQRTETATTPPHGALLTADSNSTTRKWTTLGVEKAPLVCASPRSTGLLAMRVMTTNRNPINAPADEPTMT